MMNAALLVEAQAFDRPDALAVSSASGVLTYQELHERSALIASELTHAGMVPGDRVAFCCGNTINFPSYYFGILKSGCIAVPLNPLYSAESMAHVLQHCGARALLLEEGSIQFPYHRSALRAARSLENPCLLWAPVSVAAASPESFIHEWRFHDARHIDFETIQRPESAPCSIIYTSGTTGSPKGVVQTHSNIFHNSMAFAKAVGFTPEERILVAVPLFNVAGHNLLQNAGFAAGSSIQLQPRFDAREVLSAFERGEATWFLGVPTMYYDLLLSAELSPVDRNAIARHWRGGLIGGAPAAGGLLSKIEAAFGTSLLIGYGLTETTAVSCTTRYGEDISHCVGRPVYGVRVKVRSLGTEEVEVKDEAYGEILIQGPHVMAGYYSEFGLDTSAIDDDDWLHTGDLGFVDDEGRVYIVDRLKDLIIRGGRNIYPSEVEATLQAHPAVQTAAVIGIPDERLVEEVAAFVVSIDNNANEEDLIAWCKERLPPYAYPRQIFFCDTIPKGPTGKILRRELQSRVSENSGAS